MKLRNLGKSGLRVSVVGLGCNNFGGRIDLESARRVIHAALDAGITLFDTADAYGNRGGSETAMGQILGERGKPGMAQPPAGPIDQQAGADLYDDAAELGERGRVHERWNRLRRRPCLLGKTTRL